MFCLDTFLQTDELNYPLVKGAVYIVWLRYAFPYHWQHYWAGREVTPVKLGKFQTQTKGMCRIKWFTNNSKRISLDWMKTNKLQCITTSVLYDLYWHGTEFVYDLKAENLPGPVVYIPQSPCHWVTGYRKKEKMSRNLKHTNARFMDVLQWLVGVLLVPVFFESVATARGDQHLS